jgi:hypothetical protein
VLVAQDCDLAWSAIVGSQFLVEIRPILKDPLLKDWGIRNRKFLLDELGTSIDGNLPYLHVAPAVINSGTHIGCLDPRSVLRLKTWLGLRYDRPAIPQRYGRLAKALAEQIKAKRYRIRAGLTRDVLVRFQTNNEGQTQYELVAVLADDKTDADTQNLTELWLAEISMAIPVDLGVALPFFALPPSEISLAYVEESFALDVTSVSWPFKNPGPQGAVQGFKTV